MDKPLKEISHMNEPLIIHLDSVKKWRNKNEWRPVNRAILTWTDPSGNTTTMEKIGDGSLINLLLRDFHEDFPQINAQVEVYRGDTLCFVTCPLFQWLGLDEDGNKVDKRPEHLKRK